ncbi:hypothetical protein [Bacillus fonticola]|uniref:hypothetical protein n=1 Tax=Bacillus fonticola TaxID=2728853 RepID=UPI00147271D1|nr:hypothetical protein [Bacillus fonticola]
MSTLDPFQQAQQSLNKAEEALAEAQASRGPKDFEDSEQMLQLARQHIHDAQQVQEQSGDQSKHMQHLKEHLRHLLETQQTLR